MALAAKESIADRDGSSSCAPEPVSRMTDSIAVRLVRAGRRHHRRRRSARAACTRGGRRAGRMPVLRRHRRASDWTAAAAARPRAVRWDRRRETVDITDPRAVEDLLRRVLDALRSRRHPDQQRREQPGGRGIAGHRLLAAENPAPGAVASGPRCRPDGRVPVQPGARGRDGAPQDGRDRQRRVRSGADRTGPAALPAARRARRPAAGQAGNVLRREIRTDRPDPLPRDVLGDPASGSTPSPRVACTRISPRSSSAAQRPRFHSAAWRPSTNTRARSSSCVRTPRRT